MVDGSLATATTLNAGDNLTGGAGVDRLIVAAQGAAGTISGVATNGVENIQIQSVQTAGTNTSTTFDALLTAGLSGVTVTGSSIPVSITNLQTIPDLSVSSNNANVTVGFRSATTVAGTADAMKVMLNGNNTGAASTITANGIETINVTSEGAASGSATRPVTLASTSLNSVNVDGSAGATLTVSLAGATTPGKAGMVDLSKSTASSLTVDVTAGSNGQTSIMGSAGADSLIIAPGATGELTVTGGAGNDTVRIDGALIKSKTSIDGGEGTNTLNLTGAVGSATDAAGVKGFQTLGAFSAPTALNAAETLASRSVTHKVDLMATAPSKVQVSTWSLTSNSTAANALSDSITFSGLSAATTDLAISGVSVSTGVPSTFAASGAADTAGGATSVALAVTASMKVDTPADSLNVTLGSAAAAALTTSTGTATKNTAGTFTYTPGAASATLSLNVDNFETVTLTSNSDAVTKGNTVSMAGASSLKSLTIGAGSAPLTLTGTPSANALTTIDASQATQALDMSGMTLGSAKALTVTGGAGNDTLKGTSLSDNLAGGAGFDTITGSGGNDTIAGGDGNDSLTGNSGADSISGGDGIDTILGGGGNDVLDGGAGNDLFVATVSTGANTTGGETVNFSSATKIIGGDGVDTLRLTGAVANATSYNLDFSAASESRFSGASGIETLQLGSFTDQASTPAGKAVTLKLGDIAMGSFGGSVSVGVLSGATIGTVTVDASNVLNSASTVKFTGPSAAAANYTVGNNIDSVTLGTANDTVTVGNAIFLSASDSIDAGLGSDSLTITQSGSTTVALTTATLANVKGFEKITADFATGTTGGLSFTVSDEFAAANRTSVDNTLEIDLSAGTGTGTLTVDGKAVTASTSLKIASTTRADALTGGAGNDVFVAATGTLKNGESITGGDGTDVIRLTGSNALNGVVLSGVEGVQFDASSPVTLTALASVFNGATFTVAELVNSSGSTDDINVIALTANGVANFDFSKVTAAAHGTQSGASIQSLNDKVTISFAGSQDATLSHTYTGSGLADVITTANNAVPDTLSGGGGNDIFSYAAVGNSLTNFVNGSNAFIDVLNGGAGTDVLEINLSGATTTAFNVTTIQDWTNLASVETLAINGAQTAAVTVTLTGGATGSLTAGIRNVDLSGETDPAGGANSIDGSAATALTSTTAHQPLTLTGSSGADSIFGGAGNDTFVVTATSNSDTLTGTGGTDTLSVSASAAYAPAGDGNINATGTFISLVSVGSGASVNLTGQAEAFQITGSSGAESIVGGGGADTISGGDGADTISGGTGADILTGGAGIDRFVFAVAQSVASTANTLTVAGIAATNTVTFGGGVDYISDFAATDLLDLTTAAAPTSLLGVATATALTASTSYVAYGTWNAGVFTIAAAFDASTAKDAMLIVDGNGQTAISTTGVVILDDLTAALAAANIV